MKKILLFLPIIALVGLLVIPQFSSAQWGTQSFEEISGTGVTGVLGVLKTVATWILSIVVALSVIMFVYAGLLYITSGGDDKKIGSAKNYLLYGVIGIVVALLAAAITNVAVYLAQQV